VSRRAHPGRARPAAQLIGESQQNVAFWEQSETPPRSDVLPKMAKVLGVRVEALLGEESERIR
jgi:transcriptional regulator with XRE-family HTH domain